MKEFNKARIQTFFNIALSKTTEKDNLMPINKEEKQIVLNPMSPQQQTFSFPNMFFDQSFEESLSQYISSSLINDLYQGLDNSIIILTNDNTNYDLLHLITHLTQNNLLELKSSIEGSYLNEIACASFMTHNDQCFDLLSNADINIKQIENSHEILIEGLSYQNINNITEGDEFVNAAIDNYAKQSTSSLCSKSLCMRIIALFNSENGDDIVNTYISKLDILILNLNNKLTKETKEANQTNITSNCLFSIINSLLENNKKSDISQCLYLLIKEYLFGSMKTAMITSINEMMPIPKEDLEPLLRMIKRIESIETNPISKQDTISNLIYIKSLYNQSLGKDNKLFLKNDQSSISNDLIPQIKQLLNHQYSLTNTLRRLPFISFDILTSINKYKQDCEQYYKTNYEEMTELKKTFQASIKEKESFNPNNSNGQETINTLLFTMDEAISVLKKSIPSFNMEAIEQSKAIESDAYWNLLNFYSMKEPTSTSFPREDTDEGKFQNLMYQLIELNEKVYQQLLKGKIYDSYEVVAKEEYIGLIKQLNESKYSTEQNIEKTNKEMSDYQSKIDSLNNEIASLNETISALQSKLKTKPTVFKIESLVIHKQTEIAFASKKRQYKSRSVDKVKQKNQPMKTILNTINRPVTVLSFSFLSPHNKVALKKCQSSIKVKKKAVIDTRMNRKTKLSPHQYLTIHNCRSLSIISKCISFSYINTQSLIQKHSRNSSMNKSNNKFKLLKVSNKVNSINCFSNKNEEERKELLQNKSNEQAKEIDNLKNLNELLLKQKESEIYSYSQQLKQTKYKISSLEEETRKLLLAIDRITKEKETCQYQLNQSQSSTSMLLSQIENKNTSGKESYSAEKHPYSIKILKSQSISPSANKSLEMKPLYRCKKVRSQKDLKNNSLTSSLFKMDDKKKLSLSKYSCNKTLNESTMRLIKEIGEDNNILMKEISDLQIKNMELSNNIKLLQSGDSKNRTDSKSKNQKKFNLVFTEIMKKDYRTTSEK